MQSNTKIKIILLFCVFVASISLNVNSIWDALSKERPVDSANSRSLTFESNRLQQLYTHFNLLHITPVSQHKTEKMPASQVVLYDVGTGPKMPLIKVIIEDEQHISHVGFDIFQQTELRAIEPAGTFIERYLLYLVSEGKEQLVRHLEADHLVIEINNQRFGTIGSLDFNGVLSVLSSKFDFSLSSRNYVFHFNCTDQEGNNLNIIFPSRLDLVSGKDKKELDEELSEQFNPLPGPTAQNSLSRFADKGAQLIPYRDGLFYSEGKTLHTGLTSKQYYRQTDQGYERLYDSKFPIESLQNNLIAPILNFNFQIKLDHLVYGQQHVLQSVELASLIEYFRKDHEVYVGFEKTKLGIIRSTQIFKNKMYDTSHMLIIEWPLNLLWSTATKPVIGNFYSYIRNDNVQDLLGDYLEKPGYDKIPIIIDQE